MSEPRTWKLLGAGARDWPESLAGRQRIRRSLERAKTLAPAGARLVLVHGACPTGADKIMGEVAPEIGFEVRPYPVDHALDGPWPQAGPRRNSRMLDEENRPDEPVNEGIAFPTHNSRGTWDMCRKLERAGIAAQIIYPEQTA